MSLHKQRHLDITSDPCAKQPFINCRIPNKFGCIITRWNWETVWECAPPPPFFSRVFNQGKLGLFPNLVPGVPPPARMAIHIVHCFFTSHQVILLPLWTSTGDINGQLWSVSGSSSDIAQTIELDVTAEVTFAAAKIHDVSYTVKSNTFVTLKNVTNHLKITK